MYVARAVHDYSICALLDSVFRSQFLSGSEPGPAEGFGGQGVELWPGGLEEAGAGHVQVLRVQLNERF